MSGYALLVVYILNEWTRLTTRAWCHRRGSYRLVP